MLIVLQFGSAVAFQFLRCFGRGGVGIWGAGGGLGAAGMSTSRHARGQRQHPITVVANSDRIFPVLRLAAS